MKLDEYLFRTRMLQKELALKCNCHWLTMSRIVNRKQRPSLRVAHAIVRETGGIVTYDDLMNNREPEPKK